MPQNQDEQVDASAATKHSLAERVMQQVPEHRSFTGQATLEIHCKAGEIRDVYLTTRRKMGES